MSRHLRYIGPALGVLSGLAGATFSNGFIDAIPWLLVSLWALMSGVWMRQAENWEGFADDWRDLYYIATGNKRSGVGR